MPSMFAEARESRAARMSQMDELGGAEEAKLRSWKTRRQHERLRPGSKRKLLGGSFREERTRCASQKSNWCREWREARKEASFWTFARREEHSLDLLRPERPRNTQKPLAQAIRRLESRLLPKTLLDLRILRLLVSLMVARDGL